MPNESIRSKGSLLTSDRWKDGTPLVPSQPQRTRHKQKMSDFANTMTVAQAANKFKKALNSAAANNTQTEENDTASDEGEYIEGESEYFDHLADDYDTDTVTTTQTQTQLFADDDDDDDDEEFDPDDAEAHTYRLNEILEAETFPIKAQFSYWNLFPNIYISIILAALILYIYFFFEDIPFLNHYFPIYIRALKKHFGFERTVEDIVLGL